MKHYQLKICLFLFFGFTKMTAQQTVASSGGDSTGSNGKISYNIGQVFMALQTGSNGSAAQGVQHAFEIFTLSGQEFTDILFSIKTYPNPTMSNFTIDLGETVLQNGSYQLFDMQGKEIAKSKITEKETIVAMENLTSATYLLSIFSDSKNIKTFKIIKN